MKTFFVGVKALIIDDNKVLLLKRAGDNPHWDAPGGRIDDDETIAATLDRELHEELPNIKTYEVQRLLHAERLHRDIEGDVSLVLLFHEVTAEFDGKPQISAEHTEARWFSLDEARELATEGVRKALQHL